ncbi:hypothetical protein Tco_1078469 [Tanacetum coccineum]|uniref:Uncharacterized protein n=1 Tax=Tanacetum coccineum TaxID=301880 RepID=A0ABQ5HQD0_9ASTR
MSARMNQLQNQLNQMMLMMQNNKDLSGVPHLNPEGIPKLITTITSKTYRLISSHITAKKHRIIAYVLINQKFLWVVDSGGTDHDCISLTSTHNIQICSQPIYDRYKRIAYGILYNGLYIIKQELAASPSTTLSITNNNMDLWHSRL